MATANIIIRQGDLNTTPGSRDDLVITNLITLLNQDDTGVSTWQWTLVSKPNDSSAALSSLTNSTTTFTPDKYGTYLIRLIINSGEDSDQVGAGIKTEHYSFRIPAPKERTEFGIDTGWANALNDALQKIDDGYIGLGDNFQETYNFSFSPVRIIEDDTRGSIFVRANSGGDDIFIFENSSGDQILSITANGAITHEETLLFSSSIVNSGTNNAFTFNATNTLTGSTTLMKITNIGSNRFSFLSTGNLQFGIDGAGLLSQDGNYSILGSNGVGWSVNGTLFPNTTSTHGLGTISLRWLRCFIGDDSLTTSTSSALLINNNTAATSGNQKVSPAITTEGRGWSDATSESRTVGARFYVLPIEVPADEPMASLPLQMRNGNASYATVGTFGQYAVGVGFKIGAGDASNEYVSINGPVTGFQFVVGGATQWYSIAGKIYPQATTTLGDSTNLFHTCFNTWNSVGAGNTLASNTTITPTATQHKVSGTNAIDTIATGNLPSGFRGKIALIPTGIFTWTTGGNIALAGTAVVSKVLYMEWDGTSWYPSYTA